MRKVATTITCATLLWAAPVLAGENPEGSGAAPEAAPAAPTASEEISVDNAAVNRAFAGGDLPRRPERLCERRCHHPGW